MSERYTEFPPTRPHPTPLAGPYLEADLTREIDQLHDEAEWRNGHNAKTLIKYDDLRMVLQVLKAHTRIPQHATHCRLSIQTLAGHLHVHASGRTFALPAGRILALDRSIPHDIEATEDSAFLLTVVSFGDGD